MKQQTAVEYLIEKMLDSGIGICKEWREQAKEMEKQQIIDAHISGYDSSGESAKDYYDYYYGSNANDKDSNVCNSQTEISDEEIKKSAYDYASVYIYTDSIIDKHDITLSWIRAIQWYREQLKKKQ